jgi:hypothetical protein
MKTKQQLLRATTTALFAVMLIFTPSILFAQVKVGDNPTTINAGSVMELESTNKGLLMPRISLTNTTTWGLLGTAAAGMHVYNTNMGIISSNTIYPTLIAKTGEYYWDGTGWVALATITFQPVQVKMKANDQYIPIGTPTVLNFPTTVFDVGNNKVGNSVVIPSDGLYDLTSYVQFTSEGSTIGEWGLYLYVNGVFAEQFDGEQLKFGTILPGTGRIVRRMNTGDIVTLRLITTQPTGTFLLYDKCTFTVLKISNQQG